MIDLNRMRMEFLSAVAWCGWSAADQEEIGAEIKAALDAGDEEGLAAWAAWLEERAGWAYLARLCRAAEGRIRADAEAKRRMAA